MGLTPSSISQVELHRKPKMQLFFIFFYRRIFAAFAAIWASYASGWRGACAVRQATRRDFALRPRAFRPAARRVSPSLSPSLPRKNTPRSARPFGFANRGATFAFVQAARIMRSFERLARLASRPHPRCRAPPPRRRSATSRAPQIQPGSPAATSRQVVLKNRK